MWSLRRWSHRPNPAGGTCPAEVGGKRITKARRPSVGSNTSGKPKSDGRRPSMSRVNVSYTPLSDP